MADVEVKTTGFFGTLWNSVKGAAVGFFIFIPLSFIVVYFAANREKGSEVLEKAIAFQEWEKTKEKKPIYFTGKIESTNLGDDFVISGRYLVLNRITEMYGYESTQRTETKKEGTTEKRITHYECKLRWVKNPVESAKGRGCESENKQNPPAKLKSSKVSTTPVIAIGDKKLSINGNIDYLPNMPSVNIQLNQLKPEIRFFSNEKYFYSEESCINNPVVGCERFYYSGVSYEPEKNYTAIGYFDGNQIVPFVSESESKYLVIGAGEFQETLKSLAKRDAGFSWLIFIIATIFFWMGSSLAIGPFIKLIEFIPLIGNFSSGVIRFILAIFSFIVMGITFLVLEYWYIILIIGVLMIATIIVLAKRKQTA